MTPASSPSVPERGRVLVVDDDASVRESLHALLSDDFEVVATIGVSEARSILSQREFDVVLSDFEMPDGNGMEFLREISKSLPNMLGILVTGHADHPQVQGAEANEVVVRVMFKPYDPARLLRIVDNTVKLARMRQATALLAKSKK